MIKSVEIDILANKKRGFLLIGECICSYINSIVMIDIILAKVA